MARLRADFIHGTTSTAPIFTGDTTFTSTDLNELMVVAAPDIAVVILDPEADFGPPEIVHVTEHSASAQDATILRGAEGTSARQHPVATEWVHGATVLDWRLGNLSDVEGNWAAGQIIVYDGTHFVPASSIDTFVHEQTVIAPVWTVPHNLGKWPSVTSVDASNNETRGDVQYPDLNTVVITFSVPLAGRVFIN